MVIITMRMESLMSHFQIHRKAICLIMNKIVTINMTGYMGLDQLKILNRMMNINTKIS